MCVSQHGGSPFKGLDHPNLLSNHALLLVVPESLTNGLSSDVVILPYRQSMQVNTVLRQLKDVHSISFTKYFTVSKGKS